MDNENINQSEIWIVDLCRKDDYRFRDTEFFNTLDDAEAYIKWVGRAENNCDWATFGGPYVVRNELIRTLEEAKERYNDLYGSEEE